MLQRIMVLLGIVHAIGMSGFAARGAEEPKADARPLLAIVPHTHWEGAVFKTREEYLELGLPNIVKALQLLEADPEYRFVLDQAAYVKPFLERYPEHAEAFRRFVREGRLELVLGMNVMPDVNVPGGETLVRQLQYGKGYFRDELGADVTTAWLIDTFGHHAQMPQILRGAGYTSFWFMRGVPRMEHPSEFLWEGIDGTRIPAFWLTHTYLIMLNSPREPGPFREFIRARIDLLRQNQKGPELVGTGGMDVGMPEAHLPGMVRAYNAQPDAPARLAFQTPREFAAVVARRPEPPVFRGELNPIFQGVYSSRIELKGWIRDLERRLTAAEKLAALSGWLGAPVDPATLLEAWEPLLFNVAHDLSSGVMTDHVHADTIRQNQVSQARADTQIAAGLERLAARVDTRGEGAAVLVFNPLGWSRDDLVEVTVGCDDPATKRLAVLDPEGRELPAQLVSATRDEAGGLVAARVAFLARAVPAVGYAVYHVVPRIDGAMAEARPAETDVLETARYRLTVDRGTGVVTSLKVRPGDWEAMAAPGNVIAREVDRGDLWELYRGLDGGSRIAMTTRQAVPTAPGARLSTAEPAKTPGLVRVGPVYSEFQVRHPLDTGEVDTTIRLVEGLKGIRFETELVNREKYVRYQALFPTTIAGGRNVHEISFGAMGRPDGIEFPAQTWVDHGNAERGVALLNVGLPGNVAAGGTLMLSLLRSHNLGQYGFIGGYEPGMSSEGGFELGVPRRLRYALYPHEGAWADALVHREAQALNHPVIVRKVAAHPGSLPKRWGLVEVSSPRLVIAAIQPGRDGRTLVRLYEATGQPVADATVRFATGVNAAHTANLLGDPGDALAVEADAVRLDFRPFEIRTIAVELAPPDA